MKRKTIYYSAQFDIWSVINSAVRELYEKQSDIEINEVWK
jgi:hypothetical protein